MIMMMLATAILGSYAILMIIVMMPTMKMIMTMLATAILGFYALLMIIVMMTMIKDDKR